MAQEKSKFSGIFDNIKRPNDQEDAEEQHEEPTSTSEPAERGKGRPPGKRSDPNFEPTTVLLRKVTKKDVTRKLEDIGAKKDLSELIEQLLGSWLAQRS